jgi:hypothetical protein
MADLSISVGRSGQKQESLLPILDTLAEMYHIGQSLPFLPELAETSNMDLRTLLEVLFRAGGIGAVKEFFSNHAYRILQPCKGSKFEDTVVGVKYIDGLNNLWRPLWSREARGRFYYFDTETQTVLVLKETLQRGVEVLTRAHTTHAVTATQDMRQGEYDHLDDIQQDCIKAFQLAESPMNAYLTGKVDGSLILVSAYPRGTSECRIMEEILATCGDSFSRQLAAACGEGPLLVVATQGTLMIGADMQDYVVTALQSMFGPLPTGISMEEAWALQCPKMVRTVLEFLDTADLKNRTHLCFEAFCKNRRTITGRLHTELAIAYDRDGFNLLGAMVGGKYIPHFDLPPTLPQPISLRVSNTREVYKIMEDMDEVVLGTLEYTAFLERYGFPADATIHMEGWVLLTPHPAGYDYAKIKTNLYYKCHKVRSYNVPTLLALPTSCDATYPILRVLRDFYANADRRFCETIKRTIVMLEAEVALGPASPFYEALPQKAKAHFNLDKKDTLFRMLMNVCTDLFRGSVADILKSVWEVEAEPQGDMVRLVSQFMTKHMPWQKPISEDARKDAMKELYRILVEAMNPA